MENVRSFGQWLKQRRKTLDLTQAELARQVGCATVTLQTEQEGYMRDAVAARARLDTATWESVWAEGQAMTLEQVVAHALAGDDGAR